MLRRQPSLIDQSSGSITILPTSKSSRNDSPASQEQQLTSMLSQQRRDSTKPMMQHRSTSRLHEPSMVVGSSPSRTEQDLLPEPTILSSLAEEWIKDGSPIQKLGAMLQRPFRQDRKDFITSTLQRKGTGGCINVDYAQCHESIFLHFLEQSSSGGAAKNFLYPLLMDHHANLLALFGDSVVAAVETSAPTTHPLQTRKTKLANDIMEKETRRMARKNRGDYISWSMFSTSTGILQSFGF